MDGCRVWISWEDHRRSRELARSLNAKLLTVTFKAPRLLRYPLAIISTSTSLIKARPKVVFCQNPSVILAFYLCFIKSFMRFKLIVDRHTNLKFEKRLSKSLKWKLFHFLSDYSIRKADLTIVTNAGLKDIVDGMGGSSFVLQDRVPEMGSGDTKLHQSETAVVFITTFDADEPIDEMFDAARSFGDDISFYMTGNYKKYKGGGVSNGSNNINFTGFLSETNYQALLESSDIIVVLTKQEYTLNCGSYEAVSLGKPMVLSKTETIKDYFYKGAVYVDCSAENIVLGIKEAVKCRGRLEKEVSELREELSLEWNDRLADLEIKLNQLY